MKVTNVQPPQAKRSRQIPRGLCVRLCVSCFHKANISSSLQACVQRVHATMDDDMQYDHGTEGYNLFALFLCRVGSVHNRVVIENACIKTALVFIRLHLD